MEKMARTRDCVGDWKLEQKLDAWIAHHQVNLHLHLGFWPI
jgi:hypothetical protein